MRLLQVAAAVGLTLAFSSSFAHVSQGESAALAGTAV